MSETKFKGSPFLQYQWLKTSRVVSLAVAFVVVGIMCTSDPRQSIMERMQSYLLSVGSGPMKSNATLSPHLSGTGSGCKGLGSRHPCGSRFVMLAQFTRRDIGLLEVGPHVWPVVCILECCTGFIGSKMAEGIICQTEQILTDISWMRNN